MKYDNFDWLQDMHKTDTKAPAGRIDGEHVYTIFMADFFKMPDVDFLAIATADLSLRSLLN